VLLRLSALDNELHPSESVFLALTQTKNSLPIILCYVFPFIHIYKREREEDMKHEKRRKYTNRMLIKIITLYVNEKKRKETNFFSCASFLFRTNMLYLLSRNKTIIRVFFSSLRLFLFAHRQVGFPQLWRFSFSFFPFHSRSKSVCTSSKDMVVFYDVFNQRF
jgi:hypothetical protein